MSAGRGTIASIEALRGIACLLVVYTHVLAGRAVFYNYDWLPYGLVRDYISDPLGIIQNFGFFGVALFFLISGFVITHSVQRESRWTFFVRRVFRIFPTLWFAILVAVIAHWSDWLITKQSNPTQQLAGWELAASLTGINPLFGVIGPVIVVWTLTIELFFYAYILLILPWVRTRPVISCLFLIVWPMVATIICARPNLNTLGVMHEYLPVFAIGMAIYFAWSKRISALTAASLSAAAWISLVFCLRNIQPFALAHPTNYTTQIAFVIALFLAGLWAISSERPNPRPVRFFADISYSLYLIHYPIGVLLMDRLFPLVGFTGAACLSLLTCVVLSALSFRIIEQPSQNIARQLTGSSFRKNGGLQSWFGNASDMSTTAREVATDRQLVK
jgi:exopolysaccharide production protein ExoZ